MRVISMSAHVSFDTPSDVADKIYEMVQANNNGRMKKGSNEVTKAAERGTAKFIIMACLLYTSPSPRDMRRSRMPSSA